MVTVNLSGRNNIKKIKCQQFKKRFTKRVLQKENIEEITLQSFFLLANTDIALNKEGQGTLKDNTDHSEGWVLSKSTCFDTNTNECICIFQVPRATLRMWKCCHENQYFRSLHGRAKKEIYDFRNDVGEVR